MFTLKTELSPSVQIFRQRVKLVPLNWGNCLVFGIEPYRLVGRKKKNLRLENSPRVLMLMFSMSAYYILPARPHEKRHPLLFFLKSPDPSASLLVLFVSMQKSWMCPVGGY